MKEIKAPSDFLIDIEQFPLSIFLAGSIEMGSAENWQEIVVDNFKYDDVLILNPRRDSWDPEFKQQVEWELLAQEQTDIILMYFDPNTKSPITLMELGLFATSGKLIVCCPDGYWRKGNVEVVCNWYGIPLFNYLFDALECVALECVYRRR